MIKIIPGIFASSQQQAQQNIQQVATLCDLVHIDIVDREFLKQTGNNQTTTIDLEQINNLNCPIDYHLHLMAVLTHEQVGKWCQTTAKGLIIYPNLGFDTRETLYIIGQSDKQIGLAMEPDVTAYELEPYLELIDFILVMGYFSGSPGQPFMPQIIDKIKQLKTMASHLPVGVDGGIRKGTASQVAQAGADFVVVGGALFSSNNIEQAIDEIKQDVII